MSTPTREPCPKCDLPQAADEDYEAMGHPIEGLCWGRYRACRNRPVDWRARCLKAESALALLQTPLSPEALQAIAEESAE